MKILITGAGGFLGYNLAKALKLEGYDVFNFSRSDHQKLVDIGVETIKGNLNNKSDVLKACKGINAVFHVASLVGMWGDYDDFHQTNVIGTENVISGCLENGIKKLVYTSSPSVVFGESDLCGVNESTPYPSKFLCHYAQTKSMAEKLVLDANSIELSTVSLRPHLIFGPGDPHLFPRIVEKAKLGKLKRVGNGKNLVDIIYIKNAVDAHLKAFHTLDNNKVIGGKAYFIAQERPVNLWEFVDQILTGHNQPPLTKSISQKSAYNIGKVLEKSYKLLGIKSEPPMTKFIAMQLSCSHYFNHENAKKDFGYEPKYSIAEAMKETLRN